jgi:hypothetical protein
MPNCCVNCGAIPKVIEYVDIGKSYYVACSNKSCKIRGSTPIKRTREEAVKEWNSYYGKAKTSTI